MKNEESVWNFQGWKQNQEWRIEERKNEDWSEEWRFFLLNYNQVNLYILQSLLQMLMRFRWNKKVSIRNHLVSWELVSEEFQILLVNHFISCLKMLVNSIVNLFWCCVKWIFADVCMLVFVIAFSIYVLRWM